ncbi:hypothetical protein [Romboutsia sp.]|uniref:hypothetical protein n=1 Tax=Romboutsia sp. TaxID=1965302 RepID=UPI003F3A37CD
MSNKYENKCNCEKENKVNCNCHPTNFQKCEELACQSQALYDQALCYNKKIEKYLSMASEAECKAKQLEEQVQAAWWEYNEFMENANIAACKGEELMKASCKLLQDSQECYSNLNPSHIRNSHNQKQCNCGCYCDC